MPRIKDLTAKSGNLSNADFFATDNGTIVTKIDYTALAKAIIEQYNGSTLAGSAQSVQAALNSLNSNSSNMYTMTGTAIESGANLDAFITPGKHYCATSAIARTLSNCPVTVAFTMYVMRRQTGGVTQIIQASDEAFSFFRRNNNTTGSTTWTDTWKLEPTRAEMDAINSKLSLDTYSSNGLIIHRVGKTAQLASLPTVSTTSSSAVVANIPAGAFRPASRVWFATKVYNGSSYVDCYIELATNGEISIKSSTGAVVAGYQANYTQCLGLNFLCNGNN